MKLEFPWHIFKKSSNIKFLENPPSERRFISCRQMDGQRGLKKIRATLRNSVKAPESNLVNK
jgi:hypothetical protein